MYNISVTNASVLYDNNVLKCTKGEKMKILTGIKPTGKLHLGHYFSCIKPAKDYLKSNNTIEVLIADLHALNTLDSEIVNASTSELFKFLTEQSIGVVNIQSDKHITQSVFLDMLQKTPKGLLERCHAYKTLGDKQQANMGLFTYPVLMAVDIYLSGCDKVLVGKDQLQHIEVARELIKKYDSEAKLPTALVIHEESVLGFDGRKMSKSYNNALPLDATDEEIIKFCKKIKTGSEVNQENSAILYSLFRLMGYSFPNFTGYKQAKEMLAQATIEFYNKEIRLDK